MASQDMDAVLESLGPLGRYSLVQFFILLSANWPITLNMFSMVFQAKENPFRCGNWTGAADKTELGSTYFNQSQGFSSKCHVTLLHHNNRSSPNNASVTHICAVPQLEYLHDKTTSFVSEFDLVCDDKYQVGLTQTLLTLGSVAGAFVFPMLSDRHGRKVVLVSTYALGLVVSLAMACVNHYDMFITLKFFLGFFNQGTCSALVGAAAEILVTRHRTIFFAFIGALNWTFASIILAPIAYLLKDYSWRVLQFGISCVSINILALIFVYDESLRWLAANGQTPKVMKILNKACRWNGVDFQTVAGVYTSGTDTEMFLDKQESVPKADEHDEKLTFLHLFTDPVMRKHTFYSIISWFFNSLIYYALTLMTHTLHGSLYINYTLSILLEVPAAFYCFFFLDRVGRRLTIAVFGLIGGAALIASGLVWEVAPDQSALIILLTLVGKLAVTGSYSVLFLYVPELFPTNLRIMGTGVGFVSARVGGMIAPFADLLMHRAVYAPGLVFGLSSLVLSAAPYFLPETTGRQLPQTLAEIKAWR